MSVQQEFEVLRRVPFFADIEPSKLKLLAYMSERVGFDDGKIVCRQGDPGDAAYLIIDGEADIVLEGAGGAGHRRDARRQRDRRRDGDPLDAPRNATVRAKGRLDRAAHRQGAVHAHGARIPDHGGVDHAGAGASG